MKQKILILLTIATCFFALSDSRSTVDAADNKVFFNIRDYGAKGDGTTLDTAAINKAIETAASKGGGTVYFPAGTYLSFSIRLKSNITLFLDNGATLFAADPAVHKGKYDMPEPNEFDMYQDFGHSHWQNSLMWGIGIENFAIIGQGKIDGKGLSKRSPGPRRPRTAGETPASMANNPSPLGELAPITEMNGLGTKAIALKLSKNITLKDFTIFQGGHFALLATGVDNLTVDGLRVDTNRDGFDIDACRNVRISNVYVNSPNDDAIVLKSSYALGFNRATENVTITNSQVSGFDLGTFLDGTFKTTQEFAPDKDRVTGRLKFGTESNGGFKNITISNINFVHCRGLALETVDGGYIEDISISNITMRDITTAPIFIRLGKRQRAPDGTPVAKIRRVTIDNVVVSDAHHEYASIIAGLAESPVEDVRLSNIRIHYKGGGTKQDAARVVPENEKSYPEPSMFGVLPAYGFYVRHAKGITFDNVKVTFDKPEERPAFVLDDVKDIDLFRIDAQPTSAFFVLKNVETFSVQQSKNIKDQRIERVEQKQF
ncbi:MAG TPA: glycoside hydrolase family 28 protein [Pyrinomonadaceae bacterium]|nr:glycoside hydrolase family 28 protein [Acidobacteriota bacterium]HQZ97448.1 glycoside hydrolase family 28 protein [Pyrinomonadaceae bacterium]